MPESESGSVRECGWPPDRAARRARCASVIATSVRSPLTNAPPGPSSGRWKLTAAPGTGLPVSSVISTVIGRALRDAGQVHGAFAFNHVDLQDRDLGKSPAPPRGATRRRAEPIAGTKHP